MSGPVIAFDINATRGGKITRVEKDGAENGGAHAEAGDNSSTSEGAPQNAPNSVPLGQIAIAPKAQPAPQADARFSERAKSRADLAATYAGLLGVDIIRSDLLEVMTAEDGAETTPQSVAKALSDAGLVTKLTTVRRTTPGPMARHC